MIGENLAEYLYSVSALTALVSRRIYPLAMPQEPTLPAVTYTRVSTTRPATIGGGKPGLSMTRFQIDCYGSTYAAADAVAEAVRGALQGYQGTLSGSVVAQNISVVDTTDIYEDETLESRISLDVEIWHNE